MNMKRFKSTEAVVFFNNPTQYTLKNNDIGFLIFENGKYFLEVEQDMIPISIDERYQDDVKFLLSQGVVVFSCKNNMKEDAAVLALHGFHQNIRVFSELTEIGFHDQLPQNPSDYTLTISGEQYFCISFYGKDENENEGEIKKEAKSANFTLVGNNSVIDVCKENFDNKEVLIGKERKTSKLPPHIRLIKGKIDFKPVKNLSFINAYISTLIREEAENKDNYLNTWMRFCEAEGEARLQTIRDIGSIKYINFETFNSRVRFYCKENVDHLASELIESGVEINSEIPEGLFDQEKKLKDIIQEKFDGNEKKEVQSYQVIHVEENKIEIKFQEQILDFPETGCITCSLWGDLTQDRRKHNAFKNFMNGNLANSRLLFLFSDKEIPNVLGVRSHTDALDDKVLNKMFKDNPPSNGQKEALKIMLNTPDIALIQGPPGTGKTTIIRAFLERHNTEFNRHNPQRGGVLVSAHQHDAVDNIVQKLAINSIPQLKIGIRRGEDKNNSEEALQNWAKHWAKELEQTYPEIVEFKAQNELNRLISLYEHSPSFFNGRRLLQAIIELENINPQLKKNAQEILNDQYAYVPQVETELPITLRLRTTMESYEDDGEEILRQFLYDKASLLKEEEKKEVERILINGSLAEAAVYSSDLRTILVRRERARNFTPTRPHGAILTLAQEASSQIKATSKDYPDISLSCFELHETLANNPQKVINDIRQYQAVIATTIQQSESREVRREKADKKTYDTVIIDEAARSNPLDLLIPMIKAERRLIIVGDHRQLPHFLDENIINKVNKQKDSDDSFSTEQEKILKDSVFHFLKQRIEELTRKDGIRRFFTLDEQYRTHPDLGNFVNKNFYELHGEGFKSPLPAEKFKHSVPHTGGLPAVWLDVPKNKGGLSKQGDTGRSWGREAEAKAIAKELAYWLKHPECANLSFGVISFYKRQIDLIKEALIPEGIIKDNETRDIAEKYALLPNGEERLRIGTVDSFQGKEFDVSILSVVRVAENTGADSFGHIISVNRLCVAMSRQKKLLVVAGDLMSYKNNPLAKKFVPALSNFVELCEQKGKIIREDA